MELYTGVAQDIENWGWANHATPPLISPKFRHVPVAPDRSCWGHQAHGLKLFGRDIIFEIFQPV